MISSKMPDSFLIDHDWLSFLEYNGNVIAYDGSYAVVYSQTGGKKTKEYVHRMIIETPGDSIVDHINGNKLDNRRANLRVVTPHQSNGNLSVRYNKNNVGTELLRGVSYNTSRKRYVVKVGKRNGGRYFTCPHEANMVAVELHLKEYGEHSVYMSRRHG